MYLLVRENISWPAVYSQLAVHTDFSAVGGLLVTQDVYVLFHCHAGGPGLFELFAEKYLLALKQFLRSMVVTV